MACKPFDHPHAVSFDYVTREESGRPMLTLEVGTDLSGEYWFETKEGRSLMAAVDAYLDSPRCVVKRLDVMPIEQAKSSEKGQHSRLQASQVD